MVRFKNIIVYVLKWFFLGKGSGDKQHKVSKNEDSAINDKVKHLIEMSQKSEDEVCLVLHECDYDMNEAAELLLAGAATVSAFIKKQPLQEIFNFLTS